MEFIPNPHKIEHPAGVHMLDNQSRITLWQTEPAALLYAQMLQGCLREYAGLEVPFTRGKPRAGDAVLTVDTALPQNRYTLSIMPECITLKAGSDEALCNGVQTLCQYIEQHGAVLPALEIVDWPDLANRGYYQDCSRGRVPKLDYLKQVADILCRYKINQWQLYIEHTYLFRDLSEAWREDTPLTAQEIMELDDYCAARHIELVPSLSTFGHMYRILSTKTCCDLCELPDSEKIPFSYTYAGNHHTLNVSNPDALGFVKGLIDEYRPLFRSSKFNICDDETFDLGKGRSKALAEEQGERSLYLSHVKALCEYLVAQGVTPQFWGDIMWRFPESCAELPKETICLNWGYLPHQRENEIRDIAASGITQYACPGVCGWNRWMPLMYNSYLNIRTIRDAIKSVLMQKTDFKYNLIIIDNHSTDGTTEAIDEFKDDERLIHIVPERNDLGIGGCWNVGVHHPKCGKFAVQLDSDDVYKDENTLAIMVRAFYEQNCAMVVGTYMMTDFNMNMIAPGIIDHKEWTPANGRNNALRINGLGAPRAFYTPVLREVKVPNTSYGEDYALGLNFSRQYQIGRVYDVVYLCRRWDDNSDASLDIVKMNGHNLYKDRIRTWELQARIAMNKNK